MRPTDLRSIIAQLLFVRLGSYLKPSIGADDHCGEIETLLKEYPIGGLVLFNGSLSTTPATLRRLQAASRWPLLVAADIERGVGQQMRGATVFPHAMVFDAVGAGAEQMISETARITGREALSTGIHISFSPVADVHSNPANPIISLRAFGTTPATVSARIRAYIRGCHDVGLLATAKHFPGHGDTESDSHASVPVVESSREALEKTELPPFSAAIAEHVDLIMTAHVSYPSLDPSGTIATYSRLTISELLRTEMGYNGVVISDSLLMAGAGGELNGVRAGQILHAGIDILLDVAEPRRIIEELAQEVESGRLPVHVINDAFERVWKLKTGLLARFGSTYFTDPESSIMLSNNELRDNQHYADEVAARACHVRSGSVSEAGFTRSIIEEGGLLVVHFGPGLSFSDPTLTSVDHEFKQAFSPVEFIDAPAAAFDEASGSQHRTEIMSRAAKSAFVVVIVTAKPAAWQHFGMTSEQANVIRLLLSRPHTILVFAGAPVAGLDEEKAVFSLCLNSDAAPSVRALVSTLTAIADGTYPE